MAAAFAAHGDRARDALRAACAAGTVHAAYSKDAAVDPVWTALRQWQPAPLETDPATDKLDNYSSAHLQLRTNKAKRNGAPPATPESPLFDAIGQWARARDAANARLEQRKLALVHAARGFAAARITELKRARRQIGFDDMIADVARALDADADGAFTRALQAQYAIALVDEFQDTDPRQWAIFRRLFAEPGAGEDAAPRALILIGDPKQAIYRFRGGDVATYLVAQAQAEARHPLRINFRSRPLALAAVQALFELGGAGAFDQPGIAFEPVQAGGACADDAFELDGRPGPGLVLQRIAADTEAGDAVEAMREQATAACAAAIHDLLARAARGEATLVDRKGERRAIAPGDVSVLVARNEDAARIQRALSALGIPSVAAGRCSLYQTEEALHLCWLLEALLAPADDGRLRALLASPLFGLDAVALAALDQDLAEHRRWQDRLRGWQQRAQKHGPMALLGDLCAEQAPRLLGWPDGERRLGNYLQLAEELQAVDRGALGLAGLLSELARRIADADADNDAELLRLESDAARVRIMTLHVSKGLTLDLVFIPYAATTGTTPRPGTPPMAKAHDGLDRVGWLFPDRKDPACVEEARASRAEHVRLLYVGLTRARLATWVGWGATKGAHKTALGWLLHRTPGMEELAAIDASQVEDRLQALRACAPDAIALAAPVAADALAALPRLRFDDGQAPPPARIAQRLLDRDWWVYSFSQLAREDSGSEARAADDEPDAAPMERNRFSGSRFGNALHDALERVEFAAWRDWSGELPPPGQLAALIEGLRGNGYQSEADQFEGLPVLTALVAETLNAPLPEGTRLAWLPGEAMRAEMEFHLALAPVSVPAMLELLHAHGVLAARRGFGLRQRLEGLLTGRIDLIYQADGRFYVLDYKSNQLPDYGAPTVAQAIADGEYDLQYLIYSLALHRWLRFRLGARYDIERHLGGVRYLFCRGLDRDDPARPGVHALRLPTARVLALDALLAPAAVPA
jgi:exodeoxyribonuclease V beta subunit